MAFHGSRGGSRRGNSRSSATHIPTRGSGRSRGRGRGAGSSKSGRGRPVFDSARVAKQEQDEEEQDNEESGSESSQQQDELVSDDGDIEDEKPSVKPYAALLQSLATNDKPSQKRRKLTHEGKQIDTAEPRGLDDSADVDPTHQENDAEEEEGPEAALEEILEMEGDDEETEDKEDPFEAHFANPDDNVLKRRLRALQNNTWTTTKKQVSQVGKIMLSIPQPQTDGSITLPSAISSLETLKIKARLKISSNPLETHLSPVEQTLLPSIFGYQDVVFCGRTPQMSEKIRKLVCLHAVNHVYKTRDKVIKNNAKSAREDIGDEIDLRDQGFTRPKVLMLLPTRHACVKMVDTITTLCEPEQQENRKRFNDSFVAQDDFSDDKPEDFRDLFGGNDDDMFRLGLKFTRKTIKYFSQFYNSDIIFASPLGLRMAIGSEEEKKVDHDFLSSIEIVIVDQADALLMQNWEHVEFIFEHLNLQPKEAHGCDFSRVRSWYLDNDAKYFRQNIALSAFNTPEINTLFFNQSQNWAGKMKMSAIYPGALQELGFKVKQTFSRLETSAISSDPDVRFAYFTSSVIPSLTRHKKDTVGTLIFIPSYLDFVRVRNFLATSATTSSLSFGSISEYTPVKDVARARSHFLTGRHSVLLYTERAHHFRRYLLRGVRKVIMYGLPDNPIFYKEIVGGFLGRSLQEGKLEPAQGSARVMFSKWDVLKLERVAGTDRVGKMLTEKGDTFDFL